MNDSLTGNPLLGNFDHFQQAAPFDKIREEHYLPAIDELIRRCEENVARLVLSADEPTFENTIVPLEENGDRLSIVSGILFNLNHAETTDHLQEIAQEASGKLTEYSNRLLMNKELFNRLTVIYKQNSEDGNEPAHLSVEARTVVRNWYRDFVRNGALLEGDARERFAAIRSRLSILTLQFADHVLAETNAWFLNITEEEELAGLPDYVREAAAQEARDRQLTGWVFTLHAPSMVPFMKYSDKRELRERMFRAFSSRGNQGNEHDNRERIREIVNLRLEMARLMGEKDYASYALQESMAGSAGGVLDFLGKIHSSSKPVAKVEKEEIAAFARSAGAEFELESWDWTYYSEKYRQLKYDFREEWLKPYFMLGNVVNGVFGLAERLYGLRFMQRQDLPVYHPDVTVYEVLDEDGAFLSLLYLDFFPRPGKQGGAWMTDFRGQSNLNGKQIRPHVSLVCNFSKPTETKPALLTHDEVNTFLHEFGHALHGMLSQCTFPSVSGTNVYRDFVELPSQVMENWALEKEWLDEFAAHYETGEKIPADLLDRLIGSRNFLEGYSFERQLGFGFLDMAWHTLTEPFESDPVQFETEVMADTQFFQKIPGTSVSTGFSHIFAGGYAAGYYGYKWAEVLDADAFELFRTKGIFNREVAGSFRKNVLERGGSEHPMQLYRRFRGQEPDPTALLRRSGLK